MQKLAALIIAVMLVPFVGADEGKSSKEDSLPFKKMQEVVKKATHREGFFDTYQTNKELYLAIPKDRLGKPFLLTTQIAQGIGARGIFGGTMLDWEGNMVTLEKHGETIYLLKQPVQFLGGNDEALQKAVDMAMSPSVLAAAGIVGAKYEALPEKNTETQTEAPKKKSKRKSKKKEEPKAEEPAQSEPPKEEAYLIDIQPWLMSDLSQTEGLMKARLGEKPGAPAPVSLDGSRSYLETVKGFPYNINMKSKLTYRLGKAPEDLNVPDSRYISVSVFYTFAQLPEDPMTPREADSRMGFFPTVHKDFSKDEDGFFARYIRRWRLEPGEKVGHLYKPKKPITFYLDHTVPERWRPVLKAGTEAWNAAFEQAGFKDAIRCEMLPEGADPEDLRYPTLRWSTSDQSDYGAIGPSVVDPRTGEILDADILFEASMVLFESGRWDLYLDKGINALEEVNQRKIITDGGLFNMVKGQISLGQLYLAAKGMALDEKARNAYLDEVMIWVTMHEVGHTLGLFHNFRSSTDTPLDKLHDRQWVEEHGLYGSVMDYAAVNVAQEGQANGYYFTPVVGTYDKWVIAFGYTPDDAKAKELARQGAQAGHAFGNDFDFMGPGSVDPHTNIWDLSADPLTWAQGRLALTRSVWETLPRRLLKDNDPYAKLAEPLTMSLRFAGLTLNSAVRYVGGQYTYRDHYGDPNSRPPFVPVDRAKQREALDLIIREGFSKDAFAVPQDLLQKIGGQDWWHWGNPISYNGRKDYPFSELVLQTQSGLLMSLTHPFRLASMRDAEIKFGSDQVLTLPEMLQTLAEGIWAEAWDSPGENIAPLRRDLQRAHLERMMDLLNKDMDRLPADARSLARMVLSDLQERLEKRLTKPYSFDAYTEAHLREAHDRIIKALEAQIALK